VDGAFDSSRFLELIDSTVFNTLKAINKHIDSNREERRQYAARLHRSRLKFMPDQSFWKESFTAQWIVLFNERFGHISGASLTIRTSVCYACLFGRPEYTLPCGHVICFDCLREFDQSSSSEMYPGVAIHEECVLCSSRDEDMWPYRVEYRPDLSGIRVLSLDGGGVRGIIQLSILQRLEQLVGLGMPFGEFFDLMVGTSAGK
jgi:RING-type zinc-finger